MTESQREYHRQYSKQYYQKNKEKHKEYHKQWVNNNRERWNELCANNRNKRAAKLIQEGVTNPWSVIAYGYEPKYEEKE